MVASDELYGDPFDCAPFVREGPGGDRAHGQRRSRLLEALHPDDAGVSGARSDTFRYSSVRRAMSITIRVPRGLHSCCDAASELSIAAPRVREVLDQLERDHPRLHRNFCDETGAVRRHVNLFVNTTHIRDLDGLDTALVPGDVVWILPAVSGG